MPDPTGDEPRERDAARIALEPDAVHEGDGEAYLDCPQCGSSVSLTRIIEDGHCSGRLDGDVVEVQEEDTQLQDPACTANLALELVWSA